MSPVGVKVPTEVARRMVPVAGRQPQLAQYHRPRIIHLMSTWSEHGTAVAKSFVIQLGGSANCQVLSVVTGISSV